MLQLSAPADPFFGYPPWLATIVLTIGLALAIWILGKLLKWALWFLFFAVLILGCGAALWLLVNPQ